MRKIFCAIASGEPCAGTQDGLSRAPAPTKGTRKRREGQAPPLRGDVRLLRRGRRPRRPVARRRARVGGRFMIRPYGKQGIRIATATPPSPAAPPPQCAHWGTPKTPGGGGKIRRLASPFRGGKAAPVCKGNRRAAKGCPCGGRRTGCRGRQPLRSASLRSRRDEHCSSVCPSRARVRQTGRGKPLPYACGGTVERDDLVSLEAKAVPTDFYFSSHCAPCRD